MNEWMVSVRSNLWHFWLWWVSCSPLVVQLSLLVVLSVILSIHIHEITKWICIHRHNICHLQKIYIVAYTLASAPAISGPWQSCCFCSVFFLIDKRAFILYPHKEINKEKTHKSVIKGVEGKWWRGESLPFYRVPALSSQFGHFVFSHLLMHHFAFSYAAILYLYFTVFLLNFSYFSRILLIQNTVDLRFTVSLYNYCGSWFFLPLLGRVPPF